VRKARRHEAEDVTAHERFEDPPEIDHWPTGFLVRHECPDECDGRCPIATGEVTRDRL